MTDIPPLISADAGILVGSNDLVRQVAAVAGAHSTWACSCSGFKRCCLLGCKHRLHLLKSATRAECMFIMHVLPQALMISPCWPLLWT